MKRLIKAVGVLLVVFFLCGVSLLAGALIANESEINHGEYALRKTHLPVEYAPTYSLYGFTGMRDSFSQTVFTVDYWSDDREALMNAIRQTEHWHVEPVSAEDFRSFAAHTWYPDIVQVADDMVFDAWYYIETTKPLSSIAHEASGAFASIGQIGYGFEFAVYDLETGLFIFVDQFG